MNGLTDKEVLKSRKKHGENIITQSKKNSFFKEYIITLSDPIIRILLIALAIKTIFLIKHFDFFETVGIVIAIFLASFISTISEYGSEKAFEKLQEESSKIKCRVKRNNKIVEIPIEEVVVGDIVMLNSGDRIPADGIIISGSIDVDESSITGEAKEVLKDTINKNLCFINHKSLNRVTICFGYGTPDDWDRVISGRENCWKSSTLLTKFSERMRRLLRKRFRIFPRVKERLSGINHWTMPTASFVSVRKAGLAFCATESGISP